VAKSCAHCGSVFPHLIYKTGCEWTTKPDELAYQCPCGSVKFCLLKSGDVECAKCTEKAPYTVKGAKGG